MARRRKADAKDTSVKPPTQSLPVRKSSRQRARKQTEEQKLNGDISSSTNEDSKNSNDESSQETMKRATAPKKMVKTKNPMLKELCVEQNCSPSQQQNSFPKETLELAQHEKINDCKSTLNELTWSEEVIEETIICEEMEVETDMTDTALSQAEHFLEHVLYMSNTGFDEKNIVEYTVVENEAGTESATISLDNTEQVSSVDAPLHNTCQTIEEGLSVLHVSESSQSERAELVEVHESLTSLESDASNQVYSTGSDLNKLEPRVCQKVMDGCKLSKIVVNDTKSTRTRKSTNAPAAVDKLAKQESNGRRKRTESFTKTISTMRTKKASSAQSNENTSRQNSVDAVIHDINSLTSASDKMDFEKVILAADSMKQDNPLTCNNMEKRSSVNRVDCKSDIPNELVVKSKDLVLGNEDEHSGDRVVVEVKGDFEDIKVSSGSENSNDTLSSINSCKVSEPNIDNNKSTTNHTFDSDKKVEFRNRSGSTDTTESESGSNSSGVRRSSRIRTIGLLNKRSRGRGLVTKPVDPTKVVSHLERDKATISGPAVPQEKDINLCKDNSDNNSETQSDKENSGNKAATQDVIMSLVNTVGITGYDSDSNKPVKVKSRWRRSSELEMSNSGSWSASRPNFSSTSGTGNVINLSNDTPSLGLSQQSTLVSDSKDTMASSIAHISDDMPMSSGSGTCISLSVVQKAVGAKIALPMVPELADREMEERLSQFEHLKENLYLTERYTNKETKRMLCDCFLTEEEIQRGELGCGEDCLNRLLMMECGPRCVVGDRCTNRRFQNSEYANCEVFRTEKKGFGLRATTDLYPGDFIMEYVGEVVDPKDFRRRAKEYSKDKNRHYYFMALKSDQIIDATMKGNVSRFINHSCDPNAETQKWTVNGELRIGFFSKKFVAVGEEITFDYHFQRYGKEAQKCYCEASNCRGWIGDNSESNKATVEYLEEEEEEEEENDSGDDAEEDSKESKDAEKPTKKARRRREKKKDNDHIEDEDLEEMIEKLCATGLRNRVHTLDLSRLMVRSREMQHRARLLRVMQSGEQPCRRLFLDYHGLRLLWGYMKDVAEMRSEEAQQLRLEILKTLGTLPIPNRTMLIDSKVLSVVEKWSKQLRSESPENTAEEEEQQQQQQQPENTAQEEQQAAIAEAASNLLLSWSNLKEVFRIPKKERLEQMKEHEREADRGCYSKEEAKESETSREASHERWARRSSEQDKRPNLVQVPRMSKHERRQLFAMQVAKEEEERQRRQQEDSWQQHEAQCLALGLDPFAAAGYPLFFNPQLWQLPVDSRLLAAPPAAEPPEIPQPEEIPQQQQQPVLDLPPKWKWSRDKRGRLYYYHVRERVSQWLPPPPEHIGVQPDDSSSSSECSSDESSSSSSEQQQEEEEEEEEEEGAAAAAAAAEQESNAMEVDVAPRRPRRDGLVQERIISPRREEDRVDHKKYKEIKEKLRRQKERAKLKEHFEKMKKHRRSGGGRSSKSKHSNSAKFQAIASDMSPTMERKIKDTFRINMANVMVHFLNPYRKNDCKQGRITNTDDFKHLARKLTHFVLAKELKHCKSVDELECNDNVKHKAKDFVRKYMSKFGEVYQKGTDED